MSGSHSACANQGESSHHHQQQQQQQQHSDIVDLTEQAGNDRGLSQSGAQSAIRTLSAHNLFSFEHAFKYEFAFLFTPGHAT